MGVPTTEWVYFAYLENKYAAKGIPYDEEDDARTREDFDAWLESHRQSVIDEVEDHLVKRDQFTERTLSVIDELRRTNG